MGDRRALLAILGGAFSAAVVAAACNVPPSFQEHGDWREPAPGMFQTGPYILLGAPGNAFVALKADGIPAPTVEWWVAPTVAAAGGAQAPPVEVHRVRASRRDDLWVARLEGLPLGPAISYRVKSARGDTPTRAFRAGAPSGAKFRFAVFGDTRDGHSVHRQLIELVDRELIDFTVHTGDMVQQGGVKGEWLQFFQIERPLLLDTPIIPAIGNHDVSGRNYFQRYFLHDLWAGNQNYFVLDWGNLRLLVLDTGIECRDGCAQYAFAERALREGQRKGQLMAIMLHYPPYSSGEHGSSLEVQRPVAALARKHGVELVIAGHDHDYERTRSLDGTVYVVSGSGGAPIRPVNPRSFTAEARTEPHYVLVDVESDRMILRAVNLQGDTFDTYVIDDNRPHG
jgi:3',5'-cyclic AMP phosphodiesterase CpdA